MQIKTIKRRLDNANIFDAEVNEALAAGWTLRKRYYISGCRLTDTSYSYTMLVAELEKEEPQTDTELTIDIKYFEPGLEPIQKISKGDWIDLRAAERVELKAGEYRLIRLGVGMILPDGYEAHILPRSSTPSKFGIMIANSMGVIDNSYSGDGDEWKCPAYAIRDTVIEKGDRIAQFRVMENQPRLTFEKVSHLKDKNRGGIGSTGTR